MRRGRPNRLAPTRLDEVGLLANYIWRKSIKQATATLLVLTISCRQVLLPILIALYDFLRFAQSRSARSPKSMEGSNNVDGTIYEAAFDGVQHHLLNLSHSRFRYIVPALTLAWGAYLTTSLTDGAKSTYICPIALGGQRSVALLQSLGVAIDSFIIVALAELSQRGKGSDHGDSNRVPTVLGWALLVGDPYLLPSRMKAIAYM